MRDKPHTITGAPSPRQSANIEENFNVLFSDVRIVGEAVETMLTTVASSMLVTDSSGVAEWVTVLPLALLPPTVLTE